MRKRDTEGEPLYVFLQSRDREKQLRDLKQQRREWLWKLRKEPRKAAAEVEAKIQELAKGIHKNVWDLARFKHQMMTGITTPHDYASFGMVA